MCLQQPISPVLLHTAVLPVRLLKPVFASGFASCRVLPDYRSLNRAHHLQGGVCGRDSRAVLMIRHSWILMGGGSFLPLSIRKPVMWLSLLFLTFLSAGCYLISYWPTASFLTFVPNCSSIKMSRLFDPGSFTSVRWLVPFFLLSFFFSFIRSVLRSNHPLICQIIKSASYLLMSA